MSGDMGDATILDRAEGTGCLVVDITVLLFCFFFFQAEDGIRDLTVTGVQTCALPICTDDQAEDQETRVHGASLFAYDSERMLRQRRSTTCESCHGSRWVLRESHRDRKSVV